MADEKLNAFCDDLARLCEKHGFHLGLASVHTLTEGQTVQCRWFDNIFRYISSEPQTIVKTKTMTLDEIYEKLVEMRYATSFTHPVTGLTVQHGTQATVGHCGDDRYIIYARGDRKRDRKAVRAKLAEAFGEVANIEINEMGPMVAATAS